MVDINFLCSIAVALFWFTSMRATRGHARTVNHRGRCPPDRISGPHMGRECVGPPQAICLDRSVGIIFTYISIRADQFEHGLSVWIGDALNIRT
jgi:hypothetical protein